MCAVGRRHALAAIARLVDTSVDTARLEACATKAASFGRRSRIRAGFGGNTGCLTIRYADQPLLIFEAGTGIRALGHYSLQWGIIELK
jgi:hypothetical protein